MRLLLVHNSYGSQAPSGENQVFERESAMLRNAGHDVQEVVLSNDGLYDGSLVRLIGTAARIPWSPGGRDIVRRAIGEFRPDVVHVHNTFPQFSPSVFYSTPADGSGPAFVLTAHNYRMFCAAGNCMRNGALCTKCIDQGSSIPAVLHGCYRGSRLKTLPVAAMIGLHNGLKTYAKRVHGIIAQTEFQRNILVNAGLPSHTVFVKPHCVIPAAAPLPWEDREDRAVFIGRLSPQKGLDVILRAWELMGASAPKLAVIGGGADRGHYEQLCRDKGLDSKVEFLGFVSEEEKWEHLRRSKLLVMPTQWYETFGLVFAEAFAVGVPTVASDLGCVPWVVEREVSGVLVPPADAGRWAGAVRDLFGNQATLQRMADQAFARYSTDYAPGGHIDQLERIYAAARRNQRSAQTTSLADVPVNGDLHPPDA